MGKVVYVTVIAPYVLLLALLIRGCTLSGAYNGIEYFLGLNGKGDWGKLGDVNVWVNAASQVYNSIGIGFGSLIAFSSFNRYILLVRMRLIYLETLQPFSEIRYSLVLSTRSPLFSLDL